MVQRNNSIFKDSLEILLFLNLFNFVLLFPRALINMDGIRGTVDFTQRSPFDPTWSNFQLGTSDKDYESNLRFVSSMVQYLIKELPPKLLHYDNSLKICNTTGKVFNPTELDMNAIPPPGESLLCFLNMSSSSSSSAGILTLLNSCLLFKPLFCPTTSHRLPATLTNHLALA